VKVEAPPEWSVPGGAGKDLKAGTTRCDVQSAGKLKPGKYALTLKVESGGTHTELKLDLELVSQVKG
jgi:hypothetical protein